MKLLLRLLREAYTAWVLDGAKFRSVNQGSSTSYYTVKDGHVLYVLPDDEGNTDKDWSECAGMKPSQVFLHVKHGYWIQIR